MADENTENKMVGTADMSAIAMELAKNVGFGTDESKFAEWEKQFIKKAYEVLGLSEIPDEFLTFTKFMQAYSNVLVRSVQNDVMVMQLTKRLSMFKLTENIQSTAKKSTSAENVDSKPTGFDPLAK